MHPRSTESETLGVGLRMCVSDKFSSDAAGQGPPFGNHWLRGAILSFSLE